MGWGNLGCFGGFPMYGMYYAKRTGGINTEEKYPYESGKSGKKGYCRYDLRSMK